jgi:hypothetical protein
MKDRILAAWSVLRGTHQAVPQDASWVSGLTIHPFTNGTYTPNTWTVTVPSPNVLAKEDRSP